MIRYDLKCAEGHVFEAWFANSAAYDAQVKAGFVSCAVCGGLKVSKALMAPGIGAKGQEASSDPSLPTSTGQMMSGPVPAEIEKRLAALRKEIERNSDNVGTKFATEARRMHLGETEARAIHGEATREEAKALIDEGVPIAPLPFMPRRDD
jgi:hypothetical protein